MSGKLLAALAAILVTVAACGSSSTGAAKNDPGITSTTILLGTTIAQSGPAAPYGTIAAAENAYFTYVNNNGGINGRKIVFKILDDAYNPAQTVPLTHQLVEQDQVFAMFGGLGTAAQASVRDYLNQKNVPQLFVASGATTFNLDFSSHQWTLGWQPPYQGEARIYAKDIVDNHPNAKIGVLYQNDDYGKDYLKGLKDGLGAAASQIIDEESYDVTATSTVPQLTKLKAKGADTVFIFATPTATVRSLAAITAIGWAPHEYVNSVSNPSAYIKAAEKAGAKLDGAISVSYLKDPTDPQWANDAGMQQYRQVIAAGCPTCVADNGFNIYGVAVAYTMVDVLKQAGTNMTRANVMNIAANQLNETNPFLLPGVKVHTTSSDHFPITQEQVITWNGTGWSLQGSLIDSRGTVK
jgi:branched-chain amino acid transport system substrate-binding protein